MYKQAKKKISKRRSVSDSGTRTKGDETRGAEFVDNRSVAVTQRKIKNILSREMFLNEKKGFSKTDGCSSPGVSEQITTCPSPYIMQRRIAFENADDETKENTAYFRVKNNSLVNKIREDDKHTVNIGFVPVGTRYTAKSNVTIEGGQKKIGAIVKIPGEEPESTTERQKKLYEVGTLHELIHAQAIFNDAFNIEPKVIHSVMLDEVVKYREIIPLEEALTVGFKNKDSVVHQLHDPNSLFLLNDIMNDETKWGAFVGNIEQAEALRKRYIEVYGPVGKEEVTYNTSENSVREDRTLELRETYAKDLTVDEGWNGSPDEDFYRRLDMLSEEKKKEVLKDNPPDKNPIRLPGFKSKFEIINSELKQLKIDFDFLKINFDDIPNIIDSYNGEDGPGGKSVDEDFFGIGLAISVTTPKLPEIDKDDLETLLEKICLVLKDEGEFRDNVKDKGNIDFWRQYLEIGKKITDIKGKNKILDSKNMENLKVFKRSKSQD